MADRDFCKLFHARQELVGLLLARRDHHQGVLGFHLTPLATLGLHSELSGCEFSLVICLVAVPGRLRKFPDQEYRRVEFVHDVRHGSVVRRGVVSVSRNLLLSFRNAIPPDDLAPGVIRKHHEVLFHSEALLEGNVRMAVDVV